MALLDIMGDDGDVSSCRISWRLFLADLSSFLPLPLIKSCKWLYDIIICLREICNILTKDIMIIYVFAKWWQKILISCFDDNFVVS